MQRSFDSKRLKALHRIPQISAKYGSAAAINLVRSSVVFLWCCWQLLDNPCTICAATVQSTMRSRRPHHRQHHNAITTLSWRGYVMITWRLDNRINNYTTEHVEWNSKTWFLVPSVIHINILLYIMLATGPKHQWGYNKYNDGYYSTKT